MKYLCLCYYDAERFAAISEADLKEVGEICAPLDKKLKESGHLVAVGSLAMPEVSRILRGDNTGIVESEGPYVKTNEPVGAFFIVDAESFEQAVDIAKLHPGTHVGHKFGGGIEVRPIESLEQS
jgi:hypothetical protein